MQFFRRISADIDVGPLLAELRLQEPLWVADTSRQDKIAVQRHTNSIFLRAPVRRPDIATNDNQESRLTSHSEHFPLALGFMQRFAISQLAELSRATLVRLKPLSSVSKHTDAGSYYLIRDRYHLILQSESGSRLRCGNEEVIMQPGELWWFNNKQFHEAFNEANSWRIHYIFDLLPIAYKHFAVNPLQDVAATPIFS